MNDAPLSPTLYRIAEAIGLGLALRLADEFGGGEVYVPLRLSEDHPIAQCIGLEAAERLARHFGAGDSGARIDVPKADNVNRSRRNRAIVDAVLNGASKQRIALQHGLTTRWVRRICNDDDQPSLFDPPKR